MSGYSPIRIVHISTSHTGGAGIAARRLNEALMQDGYSSVFMACSNETFTPKLNEVSVQRTFVQRIKGALLVRAQWAISSRTYFTLGSVGAIKEMDLIDYSPADSVIHVHNWFNLADLTLFRNLLSRGYRLLFTLHDMRLLTGGCHYSLTCKNYLEGCNSCPFLPTVLRALPPKNLTDLRELLIEYSEQIELVCPSAWLQALAIESNILPSGSIHFIPNVHNSTNLKSGSNLEIKRKDLGAIEIGIASLDTSSPLKGGIFISELMGIASGRRLPIKFVFLSDYDSRGKSQDNFWADIDYLMVASIADNSPNVIHEAKIWQVPVIATKVGGITELLNERLDVLVEIEDLVAEDFILQLEQLRLSLGSIRPRYVDLHYLEYVHGALEKTIRVYKNLILNK